MGRSVLLVRMRKARKLTCSDFKSECGCGGNVEVEVEVDERRRNSGEVPSWKDRSSGWGFNDLTLTSVDKSITAETVHRRLLL